MLCAPQVLGTLILAVAYFVPSLSSGAIDTSADSSVARRALMYVPLLGFLFAAFLGPLLLLVAGVPAVQVYRDSSVRLSVRLYVAASLAAAVASLVFFVLVVGPHTELP
jgi:hypothetical protein